MTRSVGAATVFESTLRGIAVDVPGPALVPQVHIGGTGFIGAADLVDVRLGVVVEAELWTYQAVGRLSTATFVATRPWCGRAGSSCASCGPMSGTIRTWSASPADVVRLARKSA